MKHKFLTIEQLEKLTTKRLLAYKNALYKAHERPGFNDSDEVSKNTEVWQQALRDVKQVLGKREHVGRPLNRPRRKPVFIKTGDYVEESADKKRWGKVVEVVEENYGHIGVEVSHYMVELVDGTVARFEWLGTFKISLLEALARAAKKR